MRMGDSLYIHPSPSCSTWMEGAVGSFLLLSFQVTVQWALTERSRLPSASLKILLTYTVCALLVRRRREREMLLLLPSVVAAAAPTSFSSSTCCSNSRRRSPPRLTGLLAWRSTNGLEALWYSHGRPRVVRSIAYSLCGAGTLV